MNIKCLLACFKIILVSCLKNIVKQHKNHCLSTPSQHCRTNLVLPHQPIKTAQELSKHSFRSP
jgi:hypothetical protein